MERKNLLVGVIWLIAFMMLGAYLEGMLGKGDIFWKESARHHMWKTAHLHGALFGILNILYALVIKVYNPRGKLVSMGSLLAVVGALLFPVSLFLGGINSSLVYGAPVGGLSMIVAWGIMLVSLQKK